jgi:hypothetical protein
MSHLAFATGPDNPFVSLHVNRFVNRFIWLLFELNENRSPAAFARRAAGPLALALLCAAGYALVPEESGWRTPLLVVACIAAAVLGRVLWTKARTITLYRQRMNAGLKQLYTQASEFERIEQLAPDVRDDPSTTKSTEEIRAAGGTHRFDFRIKKVKSVDAVHRAFTLADDDATTCTLSLMFTTENFRLFPAKAWLSIETRFDDGHILATINSGSGFRRIRMPGFTIRFHGDVTDPAELLARHRAVLRRLCAEGRRPVPVDASPEASFARAAADFERSRAFYANRDAYTWGDALHEGFDVIRKEYVEPGTSA